MNTTRLTRASRVTIGDTVILCGVELTVTDGVWPNVTGADAYPFPVALVCVDATGAVSRWGLEPNSAVAVVK